MTFIHATVLEMHYYSHISKKKLVKYHLELLSFKHYIFKIVCSFTLTLSWFMIQISSKLFSEGLKFLPPIFLFFCWNVHTSVHGRTRYFHCINLRVLNNVELSWNWDTFSIHRDGQLFKHLSLFFEIPSGKSGLMWGRVYW